MGAPTGYREFMRNGEEALLRSGNTGYELLSPSATSYEGRWRYVFLFNADSEGLNANTFYGKDVVTGEEGYFDDLNSLSTLIPDNFMLENNFTKITIPVSSSMLVLAYK